MGKALSGKLSCTWTDLVAFILNGANSLTEPIMVQGTKQEVTFVVPLCKHEGLPRHYQIFLLFHYLSVEGYIIRIPMKQFRHSGQYFIITTEYENDSSVMIGYYHEILQPLVCQKQNIFTKHYLQYL